MLLRFEAAGSFAGAGVARGSVHSNRRPPLIAALSLAVPIGVALLCGCAERSGPGTAKVNRNPNLLVIYSACAVAPTVEAAKAAFVAANSGKSVEVTVDEPAKLAERVSRGSVPDIFVSPGAVEVGSLAGEGLLDSGTQQTFGELKVMLVAPKGNPAGIGRPSDLLGRKVKTIAIATPGLTSAGSDAKRELERLKLWSRLQDKLTFCETPLAALKQVSESKVSAAILYEPCMRLLVGDDVKPDSVEVVCPLTAAGERGTRIYALAHKQSPNSLLAQRFFRALVGQEPPAATQATDSSAESAVGD